MRWWSFEFSVSLMVYSLQSRKNGVYQTLYLFFFPFGDLTRRMTQHVLTCSLLTDEKLPRFSLVGLHELYSCCNSGIKSSQHSMPTQPFTLNDVSDMFDEYDMIQSDDSDLDDKSFIQEDTDSLSDSEWSTDDDGEEEEEANEVGEEKMEHTSSKGLYLSSTMQNLLRRCAGSESDLRTMALLQDPAIQKMTSRRGSDSGLANSQESNLVCCVQTKSATEGLVTRHTPDRLMSYWGS